MRYMCIIKSCEASEAGLPPNPTLVAGMAKLAEEMSKTGMLLASEGLLPSSSATRIRYANGKRIITDGPFAEAKELIGGFAILKVKSKEAAIEMSNRVVDLHVQAGTREVEMELRQLFDPPEDR